MVSKNTRRKKGHYGGSKTATAKSTTSKRITSAQLWEEQKEKIIVSARNIRDVIYRTNPLTQEQEAAAEAHDRVRLNRLKFPRGFNRWSTLQSVETAMYAAGK
jgi:hypothetical protein